MVIFIMKRISILLIFITINSCMSNNDSKYYKNFDFINFKGTEETKHPFLNFPYFTAFKILIY